MNATLNSYRADFHKSSRENEIRASNRSYLWRLRTHLETVSYKQELTQLFLYTFKPVCRTTFETPWGKHQSLLEIKFAKDVNLLFISAVENDTFVCFLCFVVDYETNWINE